MAPRIKKPATPVPQSREEFEALAVELGEAMRRVERISSEGADAIARIKLAVKRDTEADGKEIAAMWTALSAYAEAHRDELLPKGRKSVAIAAGTLGWRLSNPTVRLTLQEDDIITYLEDAGLEQFLRSIVELDKTAILADPLCIHLIPGVHIHQEPRLFFAPLDLNAEKTKVATSMPAEVA